MSVQAPGAARMQSSGSILQQAALHRCAHSLPSLVWQTQSSCTSWAVLLLSKQSYAVGDLCCRAQKETCAAMLPGAVTATV